MKKVIIFLIACIISSCNWSSKKENCHEEFRKNLRYLKEYSLNKEGTYLIKEVVEKIEFLETKSGIETEDKGNIIGRFTVTEEDILKWEEWLQKECDKKDNVSN